mgnify:FL=1
MSKCDELRTLLLEWGEDNYLPLLEEIKYLQKKIEYLEKENNRLRIQSLRIKERNERLSMIANKRREEANQ